MIWATHKYVKIWKIFQAKDKYCDLSVGTSEKKQDGTYENSRWSARAIGKAFNQIKKGDIGEGERYAVVAGKLTNVQYKGDDGEYHDNYRWLISEFAPAGNEDGSARKETGPARSAKNTAPASTASYANASSEADPW